MLLAVCLMIAALPLSVSAAGEYVPGNPRWSGYQNQVQWDRPAGAASGDSFEYEGLEIRITEMQGRRVEWLLVRRKKPAPAEAAQGALEAETAVRR